jgi:phosphopantothenoylcysteine synthetase/decarboxylase
MKFLITAGNTLVPIDRVRCITNIFTGKTGSAIGLAAHALGHQVILLSSHPEAVEAMRDRKGPPLTERWQFIPYRTYEDLETLLATRIEVDSPDAVIHCAAVADYRVAGIFAPDSHTRFEAGQGEWRSDSGSFPHLADRSAGKVKSEEPELWLRLLRTPKLVDRIRSDWRFEGVLVKFKLEVEMSDAQLLAEAERSRRQSSADLMVANTLEGMTTWAFLGPLNGQYERIARSDLAARIVGAVEESAARPRLQE